MFLPAHQAKDILGIVSCLAFGRSSGILSKTFYSWPAPQLHPDGVDYFIWVDIDYFVLFKTTLFVFV